MKKGYDTKQLFLRGLLAFGRIFAKNPMDVRPEQLHRSKDEERKRRKSHAKFKAQRIARRQQRQLMKARAL